GAGFAQHHVVRVLVGHDEPCIVQCSGQAGFTDDEGAAAWTLASQEFCGGHGRGPDVFFWNVKARGQQACTQVARGVDGVIGQNQETQVVLAPVVQQLGSALDGLVLVNQNTIHVSEPAFDVVDCTRTAD